MLAVSKGDQLEDDDKIPERRPLPKKPLVEAIFELRWALTKDAQGQLSTDPGFRIFLGRYYDRVRSQYPHVVDLPVSQVPEEMTAYAVRHQFWKAEGQWPVTQIGPGILTVNETAGYLWDSFRPRLIDSVNALFESYPTDIATLKPNQITLRYIDSVSFNPTTSQTPLPSFLREYLHTRIEVEPLLFEEPKSSERPLGINLRLMYPLNEPKGVVTLVVGNGTLAGEPKVVWETTVLSKKEHVPGTLEEFGTWLDQAHAVHDKWFFALVRGKLLDSFESKTDANSDFEIQL